MTKKQDYSEPQLTPTEVELARYGAHIVRCDSDNPHTKIKELMKTIAAVLGDNIPSDEELDELIKKVESKS